LTLRPGHALAAGRSGRTEWTRDGTLDHRRRRTAV